MASNPPSWSWRDRARDPRFVGLLALAGAAAFLGSALSGGSGEELFVGLVLVIAVVGVLGLVLLPPWRDAAHPPLSGAVALGVGALVAVAIAVAVR